MEQFTIGNLINWVEECQCKICSKKATWFDCTTGYCDECFPNYLEIGLDKQKFMKKKDKK